MKKGLISITALAMVLGVGVAVGAHQASANEAKAGTNVKLYFDVSETTWWNDAGALTFAHCFDGSVDPTSWPGAQMSLVSGSTTKYSVEIDSSYTHVIFTRVNPSDHSEVWNRTSKDGGTPINLPSDYSVSNQWNLKVDGSSYDDGNYCGEWAFYDPSPATVKVAVYVDGVKRGDEDVAIGTLPANPTLTYGKAFSGWFDDAACSEGHEVNSITSATTVYGKVLNKATHTYSINKSAVSSVFTDANIHVYSWDASGVKSAWPGDAVVGNTVTLPEGASLTINNGETEAELIKQTVDVLGSNVDNDILVVSKFLDGTKYVAFWKSATDKPVENGYYVLGTKTEFKYYGAPRMEDTVGDNNAEYYSYPGVKDEKIKVKMFESGVHEGDDGWSEFVETEVSKLVGDIDGDKNFVFKRDASINIYAKWESAELKFYVEEAVDPTTSKVKIGSVEKALTLNEGSEYCLDDGEIDIAAGETISVVNASGVAIPGFNIKPIGNNNLYTNYKTIAKVHAQIYVDFSAKTIFVGGLDFGGFHLLVNNEFVHMTHNEDPLDPSFIEYYSALISFKKDDVIRFIDTSSDSQALDTRVFGISNLNEDETVAGSFSYDSVSDSILATKDVQSSVYLKLKIGEDEVYFGKISEELAAARDFASAFNTAIGGICKEDHYSTDQEALAAAWGQQATAFSALDNKIKTILKEATTSHSVNEIAAFVAKYDLVFTRYGTALSLEHFLERAPSVSSLVEDYGLGSTMNSTALIAIVSVIAIASISAVAVLVVAKKRKHQ